MGYGCMYEVVVGVAQAAGDLGSIPVRGHFPILPCLSPSHYCHVSSQTALLNFGGKNKKLGGKRMSAHISKQITQKLGEIQRRVSAYSRPLESVKVSSSS